MLKKYKENERLFGDHALFPRTPLREWIRQHIPGPKEGYVAEDLDLIFLRYGHALNQDPKADGQFILCEWKFKGLELPYSQIRVFGLIHRLLRQADPSARYYKGFYHIVWDGKTENLVVNGSQITQLDFQQFLLGKLELPQFSFENNPR